MNSLVPLVRALTDHKGPTVKTSFNPDHLPNAVSKSHHSGEGGGQGSNRWIWGHTVQPIEHQLWRISTKKFKETVLGLGLKALSCLSSRDCGTIQEAHRGRKRHFELFGGSLGSSGGWRRGFPEPSWADRGGAGLFTLKRWAH